MSREPINWLVEKEDLKEFIEPINIEIPIDKGQYSYIFNNGTINNIPAKEYFKKLEKMMTDQLYPENNYDNYKKMFEYNISLSYIPNKKEKNWYIGYSAINLVNAIFKTLNINEKFDYFNYNDEHLVKRAKNLTKHKLFTLKYMEEKHSKDPGRIKFIEDSIRAIDNIFLFINYDLETRMGDTLIYKNLLNYLAVKSLDILDETDDMLYSKIPSQYYIEVSKKGKAQYPNQLFMEQGRVYSANYTTFNNRFEREMYRYPEMFETILGIDEIGIMDKLEILKSDIFISELEFKCSKYKKKRNYDKTDAELSKMLKDKIDFYKNLLSVQDENGEKVVVAPIKGKNDLDGYYGFVLNNNYIVLDKFYTIGKLDKKIKPSSDEAIYTMPIDLFVDFGGSKKEIMKHIKENPKGNVKRYYHTSTKSYEKKILGITKKENVSTMNHDWFLNIYSPKKKTLNNN